jgi:hypothetical protein
MSLRWLGRSRRAVPAGLVIAACGGPPNPCADGPSMWTDDAGRRCGCVSGPGSSLMQYCDSDLGNPCMLGCFNPKEPDGGRQYFDDAGTPVCWC